jgi:hypothetical protein
MIRRTLALACLTLFAVTTSTATLAQTWEYKSYKKGGMGGQNNKDRFVEGTISLEEKDGKAFFRMNAGAVDACLRGDIPALVEKTEATTIIEPQSGLAGCEKFRYVIRNDGSGGHRETWRSERWVDTKWDHGLTPVKK